VRAAAAEARLAERIEESLGRVLAAKKCYADREPLPPVELAALFA